MEGHFWKVHLRAMTAEEVDMTVKSDRLMSLMIIILQLYQCPRLYLCVTLNSSP